MPARVAFPARAAQYPMHGPAAAARRGRVRACGRTYNCVHVHAASDASWWQKREELQILKYGPYMYRYMYRLLNLVDRCRIE
eukprot:SAG31_NODE_39908_length_284_cov_1.356757_1_plen_81_part_10